MLKGRGLLAVPPLLPQKRGQLSSTFYNSDYPMVTEEAGPALTHRSPHRAQSPKLSPGTRVKGFIIFNVKPILPLQNLSASL